MSFTGNNKQRRLATETLEKREMMAGDVGVSMSAGVLDIDGDYSANAVQVDQLGEDRFRVRGLYEGGWTKINGSYSQPVYSGVEAINIHMGSGDDRLIVNGTDDWLEMLDGDFDVQMGYGDDYVSINNLRVEGDADVQTDFADNSWNAPSQGDDVLNVTNMVVYGQMDASTSEGADKIDFKTTPGHWNAFHDGFDLDTGYGTKDADDIKLNNIFTWGSIDVNTGQGHDTFYGKSILAYEGDVNINTHYGNDDVTVVDSNMDWQLTTHNTSLKINTGSGHDDVTIQNVDVRGDVRVTTSSGHDDVFMHDVHAKDDIFASLGTGNDDLTIKQSSAAVAYFYGGSNYSAGDKLSEYANDFDIAIRNGWEWM